MLNDRAYLKVSAAMLIVVGALVARRGFPFDKPAIVDLGGVPSVLLAWLIAIEKLREWAKRGALTEWTHAWLEATLWAGGIGAGWLLFKLPGAILPLLCIWCGVAWVSAPLVGLVAFGIHAALKAYAAWMLLPREAAGEFSPIVQRWREWLNR